MHSAPKNASSQVQSQPFPAPNPTSHAPSPQSQPLTTPSPCPPLDSLSPPNPNDVAQLAATIDLNQTIFIAQYGTRVQRKLGIFADRALQSVLVGDFETINTLLSQMVATISEFEHHLDAKPSLFHRFSKAKTAQLHTQFRAAATTLENLQKELLGQRTMLLVRSLTFNELYQRNLELYQELALYLAAGQLKLAELNSSANSTPSSPTAASSLLATSTPNPLLATSSLPTTSTPSPPLAAPGTSPTSSPQSGRQLLEQRLHDLELTRTICLQTATELQLVQNTQTALAGHISSNLNNLIPLWKQKLTVALALNQQRIASDALNLEAARLSTTELVNLIHSTQELDTAEHHKWVATITKLYQVKTDLYHYVHPDRPFAHL